MKYLLLVIALLMSSSVMAHTLERKVVVRSDGFYNVQFSSEPEFPVTDKLIHFDFVIWDNRGELMAGLDVTIEIQKGDVSFMVPAVETESGQYSIEYETKDFGEYSLSPIINNEEKEIRFDVYVDKVGIQGGLTVGILVVFLLILLALMYKDCIKRRST